MSPSQVCGFIATIRSTPPRRPSQPRSLTRTSYQVGRPWMLDGKMLRGLTGTPMRSRLRANSSLAEAEPDPLTLANLTTKSLTDSMRLTADAFMSCGLALMCAAAAAARARQIEGELLHVPGPGRAALGAQPAVQADVFVLHHHAAGLQVTGDIQRLVRMPRRRTQARAQIGLAAVL